MKTFFAARPNESTTFPPTASCASVFALKFGLLGSLDQFGAFGTLVSPPGSFAVGSSHFGGGSLPSLLLGRAVELPVGSLPSGLLSVPLHPASTSTAASNPAPPRRMT